MNGRENRKPLTGKFSNARCVEAPWSASAGTDISPIESFSIRVGFSVMQIRLLQHQPVAKRFSRCVVPVCVAMAFCEKQ